MTEVKVFYNVADKLHFACRLAKRAAEENLRLIVFVPDGALAEQFDRMLWSFAPLAFVPHVKSGHPLAAETPVVIAREEAGLVHHAALLNLGDEPPAFFSRFEQLREIVSNDADDKARARERIRFYKSRGFDVIHQDVAKAA